MSSRRSVPEVWAEAQIPMFVCRHCGVFVYSPPIPHRFGVPGESCAEERVEITQVVDAFAAAKITELERDFHELEMFRILRRTYQRCDCCGKRGSLRYFLPPRFWPRSSVPAHERTGAR